MMRMRTQFEKPSIEPDVDMHKGNSPVLPILTSHNKIIHSITLLVYVNKS